MRILAIADEPSERLWGGLCREALSGVDMILSAGDLPAKYLSFLTCFTNAPIVYVPGNHDDRYEKEPPEGCLCADGKVVLVRGVRILGLGGSIRYRPDGINMYSEKEMAGRVAALRRKLRMSGGFDILLTHSPIRGLGDQEDPAHRGFECFGHGSRPCPPGLFRRPFSPQQDLERHSRHKRKHLVRVRPARYPGPERTVAPGPPPSRKKQPPVTEIREAG